MQAPQWVIKNKIFFAIFLSTSLAFGCLFVWETLSKRKDIIGMRELRLSFPVAEKAISYDPAAISYDRDYIFLMQILSPLIDYDSNGMLVGGLASKFEWIGNDLVLTMRGRNSNPDFPIVTADEAAKSLKRLIILASNSHGNVSDLLCRGKYPKKLSDPCEGIRVEGGKLFLTPSSRNTALVPMLTSMDFAILPEGSYDPETLEITSYKSTSGPYRVAQDDGNGQIILETNREHFHWNKNIPQRVVLVPSGTVSQTNGIRSLDNFMSKKVDMISTIDSARAVSIFNTFGTTSNEVNLHFTQPLSVYFLLFSERGMKEFSTEQRFALGEMVRAELHKSSLAMDIGEKVWTYFPTFGELTKDSERVEKLRNAKRASNSEFPLKAKIDVNIGTSKNRELFWKEIGPKLSINIGVHPEGPHIFKAYLNDSEKPHFSFGTIDTGAFEDINLVSYTLSSGLFGHNPQQAREWLAAYQSLPEKADRLKMLNEAHFDALEKGLLVPLVAVPYAAVVRKPWKMNFSRFSATSPLWEVTWN